jgi:Tol biopolymer transport system component
MTRWNEPAPGEREAGDRSWDVVRAAFEGRIRVPGKRDWRPLAIAAAAAVVVTGAVTPAGHAVFGSLRNAVRGERNAAPALFKLPTPHSRLLVNSAAGAWVVQSDGSKRLLAGYTDASWSPHGLFLAATHGEELRALEPNGRVHWSIGRVGRIRNPRWSFDGFRIAYFARGALRIVNGDGSADHLLTRDVRPGPAAWQPHTHALAYVNRAGKIQIANVDKRNRSATVQTRGTPRQLQWTSNGKWLIAVERHAVEVFGQRGPRIGGLDRGTDRVVAASISPDGKNIAFIETNGRRSTLQLTGVLGGPTGPVFSGAGTFRNVIWSPDGRWLLLDWDSADQWLFVRSPVKKIGAVSNIRDNFGEEATISGWCCP